MRPNLVLRRALLAAAIATAVSFTALAHESNYEETRIDVRTATGAVETVIVGALAPGQSQTLTTIAGNPAQVTRTERGLTLALAGESFDVPMGGPESIDMSALPAGAKVIRIEKRAEGAAGAKQNDLDDPGPLADGQRMRVIRQIRREVVNSD